MKHAGPAALDALEPLLAEIRRRPGLREKNRGVFYRKGKACLHFHADPAGLFADLLKGGEWLRFALNGPERRNALIDALDAASPPAGSDDRAT